MSRARHTIQAAKTAKDTRGSSDPAARQGHLADRHVRQTTHVCDDNCEDPCRHDVG